MSNKKQLDNAPTGCLFWVGLRDPVWNADFSIPELHDPAALSKLVTSMTFKATLQGLKRVLSEKGLRFGPILTALESLGMLPQKVVLCSIGTDYQTNLTVKVFEEALKLKPTVLKVPAPNPADYAGVLSALLRQLERNKDVQGGEYNIFLGPGTTQMNVASILLHQAGVLKGRLKQIVDPDQKGSVRLETVKPSVLVDVDFDSVFKELLKAPAQGPPPLPEVEFGPNFSLAKQVDAYEKRLLAMAREKLIAEGKKPTKALVHRECFGADNAETIRRKLNEILED